eukprot:2476317-Prymnesium_polylepis.1
MGHKARPGVMSMFRSSISSGDAVAAGAVRRREPGSTPSKVDVSKPRIEASVEGAGASAAAPDDVQIVGERTREERDEA